MHRILFLLTFLIGIGTGIDARAQTPAKKQYDVCWEGTLGNRIHFGFYNGQGEELLPPILDNVMIPGSRLNFIHTKAESPLLCPFG